MNYKMILQYEGTRYNGWQRQGNTDQTIQGKLEAVLSRMCGAPVEVQGSGRTDAGVHALEQVANAEKKFPLEWIGEDGASIRPAFQDYCLPLLGGYDSRFAYLR